ncbi:MAG: PAS domain S-box protein [Balneolaceae bacterium]
MNRFNKIAYKSPLMIAGIYLLISFVWIVFSDQLVISYVNDPVQITNIQTYKGWFFISFSAVVIFLLILKSNKSFINLFNRHISAMKKFEATFEQAAVGIIHHDKQYNWLRLNKRVCELLQYSKSEFFKIDIKDLVHPDDLNSGFELDQKLLDGELESYQVEKRYKRKDGSLINILMSKSVALNSEGEFMFFMAVMEDISRRKDAEHNLERAYQLAQIGNWKYDFVTKELYWSKEIKKIHEVEEDFQTDIDRALSFFKEGHDRDRVQHLIDKATKENLPFDIEVQIETAKGNIRWVRVIGEAEFLNGKCIYIFGSTQNIDQRKRAQEEIRQTYERFEKVTEATNDAIWDWDIEEDTLYWGGGFKNLFGYDIDKITPSLRSWTDHIHDEDQVRVMSSLYATIEDTEQSNWQSEYRYLKSDESFAYVIDRALIIRNDDGKAVRVIGAMTDISYHHEYEKNLQNLNEMLQKYTHELEISNAELEQFAYVASHDLQEPLRMISSFMDLLKIRYGDVLDEKAHQYIFYALDGAKKMRQVILDLLDYSKVGKNNDHPERVDLDEIVDFVCQMQHKLMKDEKVKIEYEGLPTIYSYRTPLIQIFQNLISNAIKYSNPKQKPKIVIKSKELENEWQISVEDNGIGIDPDYFEKIFIIFQRLHTSDDSDGTGIGLTIVKKIIDNLGGHIWVESEEGNGSTFHFRLPKME